MRSHAFKRWLFVAVAILMFLMPVVASATDKGAGTKENPILMEYQVIVDDILVYYLGKLDVTTEELMKVTADMDAETCYEAYYEIVSLDADLEYAYEEGLLDDADIERFIADNELLLKFSNAIYDKAMEAAPNVSFLATPVTPIPGVDVSDSIGNGSNTNGTVTITAKGSLTSRKTNTVTITNTSTTVAVLTFDYALTGNYNGYDFGELTAASGTCSVLLESGSAIKWTFESQALNRTATLTLSNFALTEAASSSNVTFTHNGLGSITVDGITTASGAVKEVSLENGAQLVATPSAGASFLGWVDGATRTLLSSSQTYTFKSAVDCTVVAAFAKADSAPWFWVGTKLYDNLTSACAAGSKVVLAHDGTLPAGDYTIPTGVTLLIPYDSNYTLCTTKPTIDGSTGMLTASANKWATPTAFRTLNMANGANIVVNGAMSISGKMCIAQVSNGCPTGPLGFVNMVSGSNITVSNGAKLYAWGYITGSGAVTVKSGGVVYESFQVKDWRGGSVASEMLDKEQRVFPVSQYYVQNIEVPMSLENGSLEYGYFGLVASKCYADATVPFIGTGSMFINSGTVVKDYEETTDRLRVDIHGDLTMSNLNLPVKGPLGINYDMNSASYVLPITNNLSVNVVSGTTVISQDMCMLPGSEITVAEKAKVELSANTSLYVYDTDEWVGKLFVYSSKDVSPLAYVGGRKGKPVARTLADAKVVVSGTVDASAGHVYTTGGTVNADGTVSGGANITGSENGTAVVGTAGTSKITYQYIQSGDGFTEVPITPAKLLNSNNTYTETDEATEATTYTYLNGFWHQGKDHTYDDGVQTSDPTCTEAGVTTYTCTVPGCSHTRTEPIAANGHSWTDATCTAPKTCSVCGETEGDALDHQWSAIDGTCALGCGEKVDALVMNGDEGTYCIATDALNAIDDETADTVRFFVSQKISGIFDLKGCDVELATGVTFTATTIIDTKTNDFSDDNAGSISGTFNGISEGEDGKHYLAISNGTTTQFHRVAASFNACRIDRISGTYYMTVQGNFRASDTAIGNLSNFSMGFIFVNEPNHNDANGAVLSNTRIDYVANDENTADSLYILKEDIDKEKAYTKYVKIGEEEKEEPLPGKYLPINYTFITSATGEHTVLCRVNLSGGSFDSAAHTVKVTEATLTAK